MQFIEYYIHLAILVGIYLIFAQSFNFNFGLGKLLNLAHVASYAVGAYTTALMATRLEAGFFQCALASFLLAGLFALLIGAISIKLESEYFLIGSLAFSYIVTAVLVNWKSLTNGVLGIPGIPRPHIGQIDFYNNSNFLILTYALVLLSFGVLYILFNNSFARTLRSQAEFELGAMALGRNTRLAKNLCFFVASSFAGLAGSLFAYYLNYIDPSSFTLSEMVFVLTIVIVGTPGSFWGTALATVFLVLLPEALRYFDLDPQYLGPMRQMLYGLILFVVVYLSRERIFPMERRI